MVAALALFVGVLAAVGYWQTGSPSLLRQRAPVATAAGVGEPGPTAAGASQPSGLQQIEAMVGKLAERMKERPDDAEGWTMLGRSYAVLRRFDEAIPAYARAAELQPTNAEILADYADAVAATRQTANNPKSIGLLERALKADPRHPKSLALAGSAAYDRGEYAVAIAHWQKILDQLPPGSELAPRVQAMIGEARGLLAGAGAATSVARAASAPPTVAASPPSAPSSAGVGATERRANAATAAGTSVSGTVTLDPKIAAQAAPDDAVFVFARAAGGSRMPLAVQRARVKDLPLTFRLDDSMAMAPGMTLSSAAQLTVGARVSKSGSAIAQPGDLGGEASGIAPGASNVAIRIDSVVGRP
jgi:cytochrome c-type biogenesis protein CcmH